MRGHGPRGPSRSYTYGIQTPIRHCPPPPPLGGFLYPSLGRPSIELWQISIIAMWCCIKRSENRSCPSFLTLCILQTLPLSLTLCECVRLGLGRGGQTFKRFRRSAHVTQVMPGQLLNMCGNYRVSCVCNCQLCTSLRVYDVLVHTSGDFCKRSSVLKPEVKISNERISNQLIT